MEKRDKQNNNTVDRPEPRWKEIVERDNDEDDPTVFDRIIKAVHEHSIDTRISRLLGYYDSVDAKSSSFRSVDPSFDEHELKYWLTRLLDKTGWKAMHPLLRALMRGVGIYYRVRLLLLYLLEVR